MHRVTLAFIILIRVFFFFSFNNTNPITNISVQVKMLMEIPEKIWACIEAEDFVEATRLFIMARHINTGKLLL